jgi:hypothetical protein
VVVVQHFERVPGTVDPAEQPVWCSTFSCCRRKVDWNDKKFGCRTAKSMKTYTAQATSRHSILYRIIACLPTYMLGYKLHYSQATCFESTQPSESCAIGGLPVDMELFQRPAAQRSIPTDVRARCASDNLVRYPAPGLNNGAGSGRRQDRAGSAER